MKKLNGSTIIQNEYRQVNKNSKHLDTFEEGMKLYEQYYLEINKLKLKFKLKLVTKTGRLELKCFHNEQHKVKAKKINLHH